MTDLSYTNKDGLNLYEGFNNGFDYHRDGASEGDGYAHGGYPEITGETSDLPNTNYKTGDNTDFFNNGNTFDVIPREDPTPVLTGIEITTPPTRTDFFNFALVHPAVQEIISEELASEKLDLTGMVVSAVYSDGSKEEISDYTLSAQNGEFLTNDSVTVSYEGKEVVINQLNITLLDTIDSSYWDGPDTPESPVDEYVWEDALEIGAPKLFGLINAREEGAQSIYIDALSEPTVYVDNFGTTYNIPARSEGGSDPENCIIIGPLAKPGDEKSAIFTRIS